MAERYFRVRIRTADDTADDLTISSVPGDANEYVISEPTGDGQTLDPIASTVDVGEYSITVGDPSGVRPVTAKLVDADLRWTLISRRAYIETKTTAAGAWLVLRAGWLTGVTAVDALAWEFRVGEAQRTEREATVYQFHTTGFDVGTSIIGGPIRGGDPDKGPWRFRVEATSGDLVTLTFRFGMVRTGESGYVYAEHNPPTGVWYGMHRKTRSLAYPAPEPYFTTNNAKRWYPDLVVRLENPTTGAHVENFTPVSSPSGFIGNTGHFFLTRDGEVRIIWDVATYGAQPAVGTLFDVYATPRVISEEFPLHVEAHPIDIVTAHYDALGVPYDAASAAAVKAAIGPADFRQRITASATLLEVVDGLGGAFGFSRRMNTAGEYEFFLSRRKAVGLPVVTITEDDLRAEPSLFEHAEGSIVNQIRIIAQDVVPWESVDPENPSAVRPWDDRETLEREYVINPPDLTEQERFGIHAVTITIPGSIVGQTPWDRTIDKVSGATPGDPYPFASALAGELYDDVGGLRGAPEATLHCLNTVDVKVGDEILLDIPWQVDPSVFPATRGGQRVVRVLQPTPVSGGFDIRVRDTGRSVQVATAPTITLAADASRPRSAVVVTITNAAALAAAGLRVRLESAVAAVVPAGNGATAAIVDPATVTTVTLPDVDSGSVVWVRAQSLKAGEQPSAFSAWSSIDLADLPAPAGLVLTPVATDGTALDATWTVGDATLPVEVIVAESGVDLVGHIVATLAPGSTQYRVTALTPGTLHTVSVRHVDLPPLGGVSATASDTETTTGAPTLTAPSAPAVFAGSYTDEQGAAVPTTGINTYGLDVTATVIPSSTEFHEAVETGVGTGVFGAYAAVAIVASHDAGRTRYVASAPSDGLLRSLMARHRIGTTVSAFTTPLSVDPSGYTLAPIGSRDKIGIVETDGTMMFAAAASDAEGLALLPEARTRDTAGDRPVMRGYQKGECRNGIPVTISPPFQSVPNIRLSANRAIIHETRSKYNASGDGTGATAYDATKPVFMDLVPLDAAASGFTPRARTRQPNATITTRQHNFPANTLTAAGQYAEATLANAPANNDQYGAQFTVEVEAFPNSGVVTATVTVAVDTWDDVLMVPTERISAKFQNTQDASLPSTGPSVYADQWLTAVVSALNNADAIRVRVKAISVVGDGTAGATVTAHTGGVGYAAPGVQYTTSAAADMYASMTPPSDPGAVVDYEVWE